MSPAKSCQEISPWSVAGSVNRRSYLFKMAQNQFKHTYDSVISSLSKLRVAQPGRLAYTIRGNGTVVQMFTGTGVDKSPLLDDNGQPQYKKLFNTNYRWTAAENHPANVQLLLDGIAMEEQGLTDEAHEAFQQYMNAVQVAIGVPQWSSAYNAIGNNTIVEITSEMVTGKDYPVLSFDSKSIFVKPIGEGTIETADSIRAKLEAFKMALGTAPTQPAAPAKPLTAAQKRAIAKAK